MEDHSAHDPRRAGRHAGRVLLPVRLDGGDGSLRLSWEAAESKQRLGMAVDHWTSAGVQPFDTQVDQDDSSVRYVLAVSADAPFVLEKSVSYAVGRAADEDLADTAERSLLPRGRDLRPERGALPRLLDHQRHRGGRPGRAAAGHPLEPFPAGAGHGLRRRGRHPGQGRVRLRLRRALLLGPGGVPAALPDLHQPGQRPPGPRIPPRPAARGQGPRQGAQRGRRPLPVAHHQRPGGQRLLRRRHRPVPHRRRDRLRHEPLHLGQRGHRVQGDPRLRTADRDRTDVGLTGLLRQGRAVPHPRRHRPGRVHRRRQRQPLHQRHGPL